MYYNRQLNNTIYQTPRIFPTDCHNNIVISFSGLGVNKPFSAVATNKMPDYQLHANGLCFPLYWYDQAEPASQGQPAADLFADQATPDEQGYIRRDAITDWALETFRAHYGDAAISKEDVFWYVYGILHSPEYKQRFAADLKKMLPRVPLAGDFWAFSRAGRELGQWHLNYETVEPYALDIERKGMDLDPASFWRVTKMVFGKKEGKPDKSVIHYNPNVILRGIPLAAYEYVVNGKPAVEWIMERYQVAVDKASGIQNDPNAWSDDPEYIVNLLRRIVRVSLETVRIVATLPPLNEAVGAGG